MMRRRTALALAALPATKAVGQPQGREGPATMTPLGGPGGRSFNVGIGNDTRDSVVFRLRPKDGNWAEHRLAPGRTEVFACDPCGGVFEIEVTTAGQRLIYDIRAGARYLIRVNAARNIFDVYLAE
jgi:hypothetical protein